MKKLEEMPKGGPRGAIPKYDYDLLFNGQPWLLVRGEDYTNSDDGARSTIHGAARRRGVRTRTAIMENGIAVIAMIDPKPMPKKGK